MDEMKKVRSIGRTKISHLKQAVNLRQIMELQPVKRSSLECHKETILNRVYLESSDHSILTERMRLNQPSLQRHCDFGRPYGRTLVDASWTCDTMRIDTWIRTYVHTHVYMYTTCVIIYIYIYIYFWIHKTSGYTVWVQSSTSGAIGTVRSPEAIKEADSILNDSLVSLEML